MTKYYTKSLYILSIFSGIVTFTVTLLMDELAVALLFGALTALMTSVTVPILFAISDRKFKVLKAQIKEKIVLDERVVYMVGKEARDGLIVTTRNSLYVLSTENNKPIKFEIKREEIKKISITDDMFINIFVDYDKFIRVFADNATELVKKLSREGFGDSQ